MTTGGWTLLILSWLTILSLCALGFSRILVLKKRNIKAPLEIDTEDE